MAYLAFAEIGGGTAVRGRVADAARVAPAPVPDVDTPVARLGALEWSVVALAERDRLSTLRTPSRMAIALGRLFGDRPNPRLADPKLEALRRVAVLSWNHGYTIPSVEVRGFLAAGYSPDQYELVVDSIGRGRAAAAAAARRVRR